MPPDRIGTKRVPDREKNFNNKSNTNCLTPKPFRFIKSESDNSRFIGDEPSRFQFLGRNGLALLAKVISTVSSNYL